MNTRNKQTGWWRIVAAVVIMIALGVALFFIFYTSPKDTETLRPAATPISGTESASVLSESTEATQTSSDVEVSADSYEQTLFTAQSRCNQAGIQAGSPEFDRCTEHEISQLGH